MAAVVTVINIRYRNPHHLLFFQVAFTNLVQWFSTMGSFASPCPLPQGTLGPCPELNGKGTMDILWVDAGDTGEPPAVHRTAPHSKELSNPK